MSLDEPPAGPSVSAGNGTQGLTKNILKVISLVLAACLTLAFIFQEPLREVTDAWKTRNMFVSSEAANSQIGPTIGALLPPLQANLQGRAISNIDEFRRGNGTILVVLRSVDWCPYCKRQVIQLQEYSHHFQASGIGLVAITYDMPQIQRDFIQKHEITIPVLSDEQTKTFRSLGILNDDYQPGDGEYGIPHPGMIIVDRDGVIVGKLFVELPSLRVDSADALRYAKRVLGVTSPFG